MKLLIKFCAITILVAFAGFARAQIYSVVHTFDGHPGDGQQPNGNLVQDADGNLYGTTQAGGNLNFGTIFKIDVTGTETELHTFAGSLDDCAYPLAGLVRDPDGILYGTTLAGGATFCSSGFGCGTVFQFDTSDTITLLHSFTNEERQGFSPEGNLASVNGELYGTTLDGGRGAGVVFKVSKTAKYGQLYVFTGQNDGSFPQQIIRDADGNLYGTTVDSVYEVARNGQFSVLHYFSGNDPDLINGTHPVGRITRDGNGNIHGTTEFGGSPLCRAKADPVGCGVLYRLDESGNETVIHDFYGGMGGAHPQAGLLDVDGTLYGTTVSGGDPTCTCGVLFKLTNTGRYVVLHRFTGGNDGAQPSGELTLGKDGSIYGATAIGGKISTICSVGCGTIYRFTP